MLTLELDPTNLILLLKGSILVLLGKLESFGPDKKLSIALKRCILVREMVQSECTWRETTVLSGSATWALLTFVRVAI